MSGPKKEPHADVSAANPSSCPTEEAIIAYLGGAGDGAAVEAFQAHLDGCEACRMLVGELARGPRLTPTSTAERIDPRTFRAGEVIGDRYEVLSFVARGGMGEVYRVRDRLLGLEIALKTLICAAIDDEQANERLKHEVLLARQVTHPNVCRILEFGIHGRPDGERVPFLTMEFLEGETVGRRIAREGALPPELVHQILSQTVDGLQAIHAAGIVHRDLKSENLFLVTRPGAGLRVVVMDFGLARPVTPDRPRAFSSGSGAVGTADYMAPEQVLGQPTTVATDVYALGVTLFEMLTGRLPFSGSTPVEVAARRLIDPPSLPSRVRPGLSPVWDWVIERCLERAPDARFASARAVLEAVGEAPRRRGRFVRSITIGAMVVGLVAALWTLAPSTSRPPAATAAQPPPKAVPDAGPAPVARVETSPPAPPVDASPPSKRRKPRPATTPAPGSDLDFLLDPLDRR